MAEHVVPVASVAEYLDANHYLGRTRRGVAWRDEYGVLVLAPPTSRHLPTDWLELTRWCLVGTRNGGTQQWREVSRWIRAELDVTTIVSYSDPSVGHTGALYRACNWIWAPTWQRLRPPPTGNGSWGAAGKVHPVKDRWVFPVRYDARRVGVLSVKDDALQRKGCPQYAEPRRFTPRPTTKTDSNP